MTLWAAILCSGHYYCWPWILEILSLQAYFEVRCDLWFDLVNKIWVQLSFPGRSIYKLVHDFLWSVSQLQQLEKHALMWRCQQFEEGWNAESPHAGWLPWRAAQTLQQTLWDWQKLCQATEISAFMTLVSVQFSSVTQSCPTFCDPMNRSTPGLPVHHHLPEFTQTHVHWVHDAIQSSHPRSSPSPPAPNPSQHQSLFQWVNSSHEVAKVLEFQL